MLRLLALLPPPKLRGIHLDLTLHPPAPPQSNIPVREKRRQEELKLLEVYVDKFSTMQNIVRSGPVK